MNRTSRTALVGVAASALMLTAIPPASAAIEIGVGIKGVELGMNKTEVIEQVGDPKWVEKGTSEFGKYKILHYGRRLKVNLLGGEVVQVSTKARKQKTPEGIGVGSRRKAVKKNVPGVVCDNVSGLKSCHVNDFLPGEIVTVFRLKHRRVTQVDIGRVID